ncbi:MAG: adenosylcobinamide-phosphate synthase CbiB [Polyangiaceae bacterium]
MLYSLAVLLAALAVDLVLGEPPNALHPVVWMGKLIAALERRLPRGEPWLELCGGALVTLLVPLAFGAAAWGLLHGLERWSAAHFVVSVWLLKSSFAFRGLGHAAFGVRDALARGDLAAARHALRSLCSRDPSALDAPLLVAATVESVAENTSDSVIAPLFFYALFGVPGAIVYRAVNTLDSMIGYHGRFEYIGKVAARLDDALNYVPARLTAALLLIGGVLARRDARGGWSMWRRDGGKTESPNAGQPMATMAGLLGVQLEKVGHYRLGDPGQPLVAVQIDRAWRIVTLGVVVALAAWCSLLALV